MLDHDVQIQRYWINKIFCRHSKSYRRILKASNGVVSYCDKCKLKHTGIHDFGIARFK